MDTLETYSTFSSVSKTGTRIARCRRWGPCGIRGRDKGCSLCHDTVALCGLRGNSRAAPGALSSWHPLWPVAPRWRETRAEPRDWGTGTGAGTEVHFIVPLGRANLSPSKLSYLHVNKSSLGPHCQKHPTNLCYGFRPAWQRGCPRSSVSQKPMPRGDSLALLSPLWGSTPPASWLQGTPALAGACVASCLESCCPV